MPRILIFANGELPDLEKARVLIHPHDYIICADGGTRHALALGLTPDLIVGDLDSVTDDELRIAQGQGAQVVRHPRDKNEVDLELAIRQALERKPSSILVVAALGNRIDQTLGNLALLGDPQLTELDVRLDDGVEEVLLCRAQVEVKGGRGELVSLIPWGGQVEGVRTEGLRWPLTDETLYPDKTRGISNKLLDETATVSLRSGLLVVIHRRNNKS